jgi:hypothetical protein
MILRRGHVRESGLQCKFEKMTDERDDEKYRDQCLPCRFHPSERLDQRAADAGKSETKSKLQERGPEREFETLFTHKVSDKEDRRAKKTAQNGSLIIPRLDEQGGVLPDPAKRLADSVRRRDYRSLFEGNSIHFSTFKYDSFIVLS